MFYNLREVTSSEPSEGLIGSVFNINIIAQADIARVAHSLH